MQWPFPAARLNYKAYGAINLGVATYIDSLKVVRSFNSFWGTTRFNINNKEFLTWTSTVNPSINITGKSAVSVVNLDWCAIAFEFKECASTTPYYYIPTAVCYDVCPPRMYGDNVLKVCQNCPLSAYDCYTCDSAGFCLTCSSSLDLRVLDVGTGRCVPIDGYYDDNTNTTLPKLCNQSACETCNSTSTQCWTCHPGFYISGTSCLPCATYCISCTSSSSCMACLSGSVLVNGVC